MDRKGKSQRQLSDWLAERGILVSPQYLSDVLRNRRDPGPRFKEVFREITGITLVDGLIEDVRSRTGKE